MAARHEAEGIAFDNHIGADALWTTLRSVTDAFIQEQCLWHYDHNWTRDPLWPIADISLPESGAQLRTLDSNAFTDGGLRRAWESLLVSRTLCSSQVTWRAQHWKLDLARGCATDCRHDASEAVAQDE